MLKRGTKSVTWTQAEGIKKRPSSVQKMEIHKLPWGGRYKPGADRRRCHQSGQWLARIYSLVSQRAAKDKGWKYSGVLWKVSRERRLQWYRQSLRPLAQQVLKKYKLKANSSLLSPKSNFWCLSPPHQTDYRASSPSSKNQKEKAAFGAISLLDDGRKHLLDWVFLHCAPCQFPGLWWHSDFRALKADSCVLRPASWPTFHKVSHI